MTIVTIVGAGLMGSATAYPLSDNGHTVRLVGTHLDGAIIASCRQQRYHPRLRRVLPAGVQAFYVEELDQALEGAEVIVSGVNSMGVHWIGQTLGPRLRPGQMLIAITKGLEVGPDGGLAILPDVLARELPAAVRGEVTLAAVGGPCIAGELAGRRPSLVMFGARDAAAVRGLAGIFRTPYYHIWPTTDLLSLELCAALKNAYTLGVGLAAGLLARAGGVDAAGAHMHNLAAGLFGQSVTEMARLVAVLGGDPAFAWGLPGAGDQYVTCMGGRTVKLGRLLGEGHSYAEARALMAGETLESVEIIRTMAHALPGLEASGAIGAAELPLLRALIGIVVHGQPADLPLDAFFGGV